MNNRGKEDGVGQDEVTMAEGRCSCSCRGDGCGGGKGDK